MAIMGKPGRDARAQIFSADQNEMASISTVENSNDSLRDNFSPAMINCFLTLGVRGLSCYWTLDEHGLNCHWVPNKHGVIVQLDTPAPVHTTNETSSCMTAKAVSEPEPA